METWPRSRIRAEKAQDGGPEGMHARGNAVAHRGSQDTAQLSCFALPGEAGHGSLLSPLLKPHLT